MCTSLSPYLLPWPPSLLRQSDEQEEPATPGPAQVQRQTMKGSRAGGGGVAVTAMQARLGVSGVWILLCLFLAGSIFLLGWWQEQSMAVWMPQQARAITAV